MYKHDSLGLKEARVSMDAMLDEAMKEPGQPVAVAVVDNHGEPICLAAMDGATAFNRLMAVRKAGTAAQVGIDTSLFGQALPAMNMSITDFGSVELTVVPGGVAVRGPSGGAVIGGIGVSGRLPEEDERLARAGLEALARP